MKGHYRIWKLSPYTWSFWIFHSDCYYSICPTASSLVSQNSTQMSWESIEQQRGKEDILQANMHNRPVIL